MSLPMKAKDFTPPPTGTNIKPKTPPPLPNKIKTALSGVPKNCNYGQDAIPDPEFNAIVKRFMNNNMECSPLLLEDLGRIMSFLAIRAYFSKTNDLFGVSPVLRFMIDPGYGIAQLRVEFGAKYGLHTTMTQISAFYQIVESVEAKAYLKAAIQICKEITAEKEKSA